jgi:hypothetical protein
MKRTIYVLLGNCVLSYAFSWWVDDGVYLAWFMIAVDAVSAWIITWRPAAKWQAVIGLTYVIQIASHIGRLAANNPDLEAYGWGLTVVSFAQLLLVAGWWGHAKLSRHHGRGSDYTVAAKAHRQSLG